MPSEPKRIRMSGLADEVRATRPAPTVVSVRCSAIGPSCASSARRDLAELALRSAARVAGAGRRPGDGDAAGACAARPLDGLALRARRPARRSRTGAATRGRRRRGADATGAGSDAGARGRRPRWPTARRARRRAGRRRRVDLRDRPSGVGPDLDEALAGLGDGRPPWPCAASTPLTWSAVTFASANRICQTVPPV